MRAAGIVAEYNPFHTGHRHQIQQTRQLLGEETAMVAVMSGNWVQQADCAIADKWTRARLAVLGGADLVLELPTVWAVSSAESFARGAVSILSATGVAGHLSFGSECGAIEPLEVLARCLDTPEYTQRLAGQLKLGKSFGAARQDAASKISGCKAELLSTPNNNLGVEYIRAISAIGANLKPVTVQRLGGAHNSVCNEGEGHRPEFVSATQIRRWLHAGQWERAQSYLGTEGPQLLQGHLMGLPSMTRVERALLARLRYMDARQWASLPDSGQGEGLPNRLERAGRMCTSVEEFLQLAKTKRYTHARLRRLLLWAYLGLSQDDVPQAPPYLRVLAMNGRGRGLLREMKKRASLPILTKPAHATELDRAGRELFELEARCTDLYHLCFEQIVLPGEEWTTGPAIIP